MATQLEVIQKLTAALNTTTLKGTAALDAAIAAATNGKFNSAQAVKSKMVHDCEISDSNTFLQKYCGIVLGNNDTGAITGKDAGSSTKDKTAESIIPESGVLKEFRDSSFTVGRVTFKLGTANLNDSDQIFMWSAMHEWYMKNGLSLIDESYDYVFDENASFTTITVNFVNGNSEHPTWDAWSDYDERSLNINTQRWLNLNKSNLNGKGTGEALGYLDRAIAHELTHLIMYSQVNQYTKLPGFVKEGFCELVHGVDDNRENSIWVLSLFPSSLSSYLNLESTSANSPYNYASGYMFLRYLAQQAASSSSTSGLNMSNTNTNTIVSGSNYADDIYNAAGGTKVLGGNGDDYIYSSTDENYKVNSKYGQVTIDGGNGNDTIVNYDPNVSISGGAGGDLISLKGYCVNITVNGGTGNDMLLSAPNKYGVLYQYKSGDGDDIIPVVNENDTLHITSGGIASSVTSGSDAILYIGKFAGLGDGEEYDNEGSITLKDYVNKKFYLKIGTAAAKQVSIPSTPSNVVSLTSGNDNYNNTLSGATIYGGAGNDTLKNSGAQKVMLSGGNGKDSLLSYGSKITVDGGNDADYILIYNNSTDTTVIGGAGNDQIYSGGYIEYISGGEGSDYIYLYTNASNTTVDGSAGNDQIYSGGEIISISGGDGADYIHLYTSAEKTTVNAGKGNDSVMSYSTLGTLYQYANGDGKDTITGFSENDTLHITSGSVSKATVSGSNVVLTVGSGTITLKDYKGKQLKLKINSGSVNSTVIGGTQSNVVSLTSGNDNYANSVSGAVIHGLAGNDIITNSTTNVTIYGGAGNDNLDNRNRNVLIHGDAGNDKILNTSTNVTIYGGAGADSIENHSASSGATIHGDAGNDTIKSNGSFAQIFGDAGNDKISLGSYAKGTTVEGGAGNDTLYSNGAGNLFRYSSGHGNDTLYGSSTNDTLQIGASYSTSVKGRDLIVKVGSNSITVKNYASSKINLVRSGSSSMWFTDDDTNFIDGSAKLDNISEVSADNYSIAKVDVMNFKNLAQIENNAPVYISNKN